jgi:hypothetical protein
MVVVGGQLRQARREAPAVSHLTKLRGLRDVTAGPKGTVIVFFTRYGNSKAPLAVVYDVEKREKREIAAEALGVRQDDVPEVLRYAPNTERLAGLYRGEVRSVPFAST